VAGGGAVLPHPAVGAALCLNLYGKLHRTKMSSFLNENGFLPLADNSSRFVNYIRYWLFVRRDPGGEKKHYVVEICNFL
jgi:hypothetical protein